MTTYKKCDACGEMSEDDKQPEGWLVLVDAEGEIYHFCSLSCVSQFVTGELEAQS